MLSADSLRKLDREIAKYPAEQMRSAVMSALILAQGRAWLALAEVMTSSPAISTCPGPGLRGGELLHDVQLRETDGTSSPSAPICLRPAGRARGGGHLCERLGIGFNETTPDGRFTSRRASRMGACAMAPVVLVNNKKMHDYMDEREARPTHRELK
jgi:NADH-quinone oxidoreductase subunit E